MAAAVRVSARGSALRGDRRCCALSGGERGSKLAAGADAELGEDLPQVVGDGGGADEQLRADLGVGGALAGQAGDQRFLRGQGIGRLDGALPGVPAGGPQLDARPFGERRGADRVEDLVRAGELVAGVAPAPLAAQPLAVDQVGAGQVRPQAVRPKRSMAARYRVLAASPSLTSARERASAPSFSPTRMQRSVPMSGRRQRQAGRTTPRVNRSPAPADDTCRLPQTPADFQIVSR